MGTHDASRDRQQRSRWGVNKRWWVLIIALVAAVGIHLWCVRHFYVPLPKSLYQQYSVSFKWQGGEGVTELHIMPPGEMRNGTWRFFVRRQVKPVLASYMKASACEAATGYAVVSVARLIPVAYPDAWGSDGLVVHGCNGR